MSKAWSARFKTSLNPFIQEFRREYRPLELQENTEEEIYDKQRDLADEIFLEWKSKK